MAHLHCCLVLRLILHCRLSFMCPSSRVFLLFKTSCLAFCRFVFFRVAYCHVPCVFVAFCRVVCFTVLFFGVSSFALHSFALRLFFAPHCRISRPVAFRLSFVCSLAFGLSVIGLCCGCRYCETSLGWWWVLAPILRGRSIQ